MKKQLFWFSVKALTTHPAYRCVWVEASTPKKARAKVVRRYRWCMIDAVHGPYSMSHARKFGKWKTAVKIR